MVLIKFIQQSSIYSVGKSVWMDIDIFYLNTFFLYNIVSLLRGNETAKINVFKWNITVYTRSCLFGF